MLAADAGTLWIAAAGAGATIVVAVLASLTARWTQRLQTRAAAADTLVDVRKLRFDELKTVNENLRADKVTLTNERDAATARAAAAEAELARIRNEQRPK